MLHLIHKKYLPKKHANIKLQNIFDMVLLKFFALLAKVLMYFKYIPDIYGVTGHF